MKHNERVNLENLDFKLVDKEVEADKVARATTVVIRGTCLSLRRMPLDLLVEMMFLLLDQLLLLSFHFFLSIFFGVLYVFGLLTVSCNFIP